MNHTCHAYGCTTIVPPRMFCCRSHWAALRPVLQAAIWREYKSGQERTKTPSVRYLAVQQRAVAELAFKPYDEEAGRIAAEYLWKSEEFRGRAIAAGLGDPLIGLTAHAPVLA